MTRLQIEQMYRDAVGCVTCLHGVYLPSQHCSLCGDAAAKECRELAFAIMLYGGGL